MLLHNGVIHTMDPRLPRVGALAIGGDTILGGVDVREGDADRVGHRRIDLEGRCVLPGFCDSHVHFLSWALARLSIDLSGADSGGEALAAVAAAAATAGGGWLIGRGWRCAAWPEGQPDPAALDAVTGDRPAALWAHDGHTLWINRAAAATAGLPGAAVLHERDAWAFPLPRPDPLTCSRAVREAMAVANSRGVVAICDFQADGGRGLWQRLAADRRLTLRVAMALPVETLAAAARLELRGGFGTDLLRIGPVKVFMDGTLGSRTAWMLDGSGDVLTTAEQLAATVREAAPLGLSVAVHAIGDAANRAALDAFEQTRAVWQEALLRPRIEHAQCVTPDDLPRFSELGVIASIQPAHATSDRDVADRLWASAAGRPYPTRDLLDAGAHLALGSDAPVEDLDPLAGIRAAVDRTVDGREPWHPEQRLAAADAVHGFTAGGAHALGEERRRGLLLPGHAADLVVLDTDIVSHPERIAGARVVATMLAGRWVYGEPPW
jgi:predicted amidohydrolase YtcJ